MNKLFRVISIALFSSVILPLSVLASLEVHFIDVGQGDSILFRGTDGTTLLVDCGDDAWDGGLKVLAFCRSHGIRKIDTALLTHPHDDHYGGFTQLIGRIPIGRMLYGTRVTTAKYRRFENMVSGAGIDYTHIDEGYTGIDLGPGISVKVLHSGPPIARDIVSTAPVPAREAPDERTDLNSFSIALRIVDGSASFFADGDATARVEQYLLASGSILKSTVYKAAHHGSRYSNCAEILKAVSPETVVIQCGRNNPFGHPHEQALQRIGEVCGQLFRNDLQGTISCVSDGTNVAVFCEQVVQTTTLSRRPIIIDAGHDNCFAVNDKSGAFYLQVRRSGFRPTAVRKFRAADLATAAAVIIPWPRKAYDDYEIQLLRAFVETGGRLLVSSGGGNDMTVVNELLEKIGSSVRADSHLVVDAERNLGGSLRWQWIPRIRVEAPFFSGEIVIHGACALHDTDEGNRAKIWAHTYDSAALLADDDLHSTEQGIHNVIAVENLGEGAVLVVGGTPFSNRAYSNGPFLPHDTPEFNRSLVLWLTGKLKQIQQGIY